MSPTLWFSIRIRRQEKRFWLPLPLLLILPLVLAVEVLTILPVAIYCIRKREYLPLKVVSRLYLSRFIFALMLHGGGFKVNVCQDNDLVRIGG